MILPPYLYDIQKEIEAHARSFGLDFFEQVFDILDYRTMNEVASYGGFPTRYPHWRFGMEYEQMSKSYAYGLSKIYEMVINNDPCYAYLLEGNSLVDQKMVISHVCAHNDFFKNNYYFSKTNRRMIDEMANHATRVRRHIDRFGQEKVENFIDVCLSLDNLIDPMSMFIAREPAKKLASKSDDQTQASDREDDSGSYTIGRGGQKKLRLKAKSYMEKYINPPEEDELASDTKKKRSAFEEEEPQVIERERFPAEPQRDVLKFLLEHGPLDGWQQDILEIIREEAYYYAPQGMTKIMNEGWATYWHSKIMTQKVLNDSEIIDYADHAAGVLGGGRSLNPYKIGVELLRHIEERWDTGRFGKEYEECDDLEAKRSWNRKLGKGREKIFQVRALYNDVMFIDEFFTEEFCREQLFYTFGWNERSSQWEIQSRQYREIKQKLLTMLTNQGNPFIFVEDGNYDNRGELMLWHKHDGVDLKLDWARDTLVNLYKVWRRPANIRTLLDGHKKILTFDGKNHSEKSDND